MAILALAACGNKGGAEEGEGEAEVTPEVVAQTAVAQVQPFAVTVTALGLVDAAPGHVAELASPAQARVVRIYVSTGQAVSRGQPLVALDQTVFAAEVRRTDVARVTAQQAYDRARRLADAGILPRKDAETAAAALADANAAAIAARNTAAQAVMRSPISGIVAAVNARLNAQADPATTLVQVVDPSGLEIHLSVPPDQAGRIQPRQPVHLSVGRAAGGAALGDGVVTGIGAVIDTANGSVDVRAALTRPAGRLFVGQDVFATIDVARQANVVTVPAAAVVPAEGGQQVFVVDAKGIAHATPVTVGERREDVVAVTRGLSGGETVVAQGAYGVQDGAHVRSQAPTTTTAAEKP
ncbi:MAG TPA: efflux RND transporter periplasmic adaptor subunit [Longimicrobium sp.]|nr:efflux RND transporter periplasmic adaptor subunit [Longimicrobium sp.]